MKAPTPKYVIDHSRRRRLRWPLSREATDYALVILAMAGVLALSAYLATHA